MSVSDLQKNLIKKGYDAGIVDGKLGALTFQALAAFITDGKAPKGTGDLLALALRKVVTERLDYIHFFAQVAHESNFKPVEESLNYSATALAKFVPKRMTAAQAQQYGRTAAHKADQVAIGNTIYGGAWGEKNLGNTQPGDGYLYRGRGLIQLTGRGNYAKLGAAYELNPDLLLTPAGSVTGAVDFWKWKKVSVPALADDVREVTLRVNGGYNGLDERTALTNRIKAIWPA